MGASRWLRVLAPAVLILIWLVLFGFGGSSFQSLTANIVNDQAQFLPAEAEATKVNQIQQEFNEGENVIPAVVVYSRDGGLTPADRQAIAADVAAFSGIAGVAPDGVSPVIPSTDGQAAEVFVQLPSGEHVATTVDQLRSEIASTATNGLTAAVTGPAGFIADLNKAFAGVDGLLLAVALGAIFIILIIVYRSPLLPLIVLGTSMSALCASVLVLVGLAESGFLTINGQTQGILFILVIGAATDYSLLYISRYREALHAVHSKWEATLRALRGSWEPIVASGGTVIAGVLMLLISSLNSNKTLGPVAAIGIMISVAAALTLLPALLLWAGRAAFWPARPHVGAHQAEPDAIVRRGFWSAVARLVARRRRSVWIVCTLLLAVMGIGLLGLKADGVPTSEYVLGYSQSRDGRVVLSEHFPAGSGSPAIIIAPESSLEAAGQTALQVDGVASVGAVSAESPSGLVAVTEAGIQPTPSGVPASPTVVDGNVQLQATMNYASDSQQAEDTLVQLRDQLASVSPDIIVGGQTAIALDTKTAAIHDRNLIIPLVLLVIMLILMLLLRAIVAPLLLIGTVVLSFAAALGFSAIVFDWIFHFPGADPAVPLFAFIFLVALGVDYNIFLMTRVREEALRFGARDGVLRGLIVTGGVITSAGVVLAATFAALGVLPILFLAQISFIVAFGVLLDTFLVRSLLVPALCYDIGRSIWWPSRLARK